MAPTLRPPPPPLCLRALLRRRRPLANAPRPLPLPRGRRLPAVPLRTQVPPSLLSLSLVLPHWSSPRDDDFVWWWFISCYRVEVGTAQRPNVVAVRAFMATTAASKAMQGKRVDGEYTAADVQVLLAAMPFLPSLWHVAAFSYS
jgi:DNA gyrase subunit B